MECKEFLARSSELLDGQVDGDELGAMEEHLSHCFRCRDYQSALEKGLDLLRGLPSLDVEEDFHPDLQRRIHLTDDLAEFSRAASGSGATPISLVAMAALLTFVAWAPRMGFKETALELPAIVVDRPPAYTFTPRPRMPNFSRTPSVFMTADFREGLWVDTHQLLFEYSSLSQRRRGQSLSRVGLQ